MEYLFNTKMGREKLFKFVEKIKIASKNGYCEVVKTFSFVSQIGISLIFLISWPKEAIGQLDGDMGQKIENQQACYM